MHVNTLVALFALTVWVESPAGEINPDALAHVSSKRHEWLASINSTLNEWASTAVDSPIKLWWANFVYQNSPYFFSTPPSAPQVGGAQSTCGAPLS
jgi:hypothetical protein